MSAIASRTEPKKDQRINQNRSLGKTLDACALIIFIPCVLIATLSPIPVTDQPPFGLFGSFSQENPVDLFMLGVQTGYWFPFLTLAIGALIAITICFIRQRISSEAD